jgi:hypothetical protein
VGKKVAVGIVCPDSSICLCLVHVFRILVKKCGKNHNVGQRFWPTMRGSRHAQNDCRDLPMRTFVTNHRGPA